ncbi:MAG: Dyp-type peroxidase [Nocardioidaceae bacterium]|nr:Dyp-type peroxidase [Nocardioidaceae bacterium]
MAVPQHGIFAFGTSAHSYLELDLLPGADPRAAVLALAEHLLQASTMQAANLVGGVRPELWAQVAPESAPVGATGFTEPVTGADGFTMPATQHDLAVWVSAGARDVVFDGGLELTGALAGHASLVEETFGWSYHRDLDLTGFIDGTENPALAEAPGAVLVPEGEPGAGGSVLLLQKWAHETAVWTALSDAEQEQVIGRTKTDSVELDPRPETAHAARTDQDEFGKILRRNTGYGTVLDHGTMFVGFSARRSTLHDMLRSMAGVDGPRDALTRYTRALTGAYYVVPSVDDLRAITSVEA